MDNKEVPLASRKARRKDRGAQLVEFGAIVLLVAIVAIPSVKSVGQNVNCVMTTTSSSMAAASTPGLPIGVPAICAGIGSAAGLGSSGG